MLLLKKRDINVRYTDVTKFIASKSSYQLLKVTLPILNAKYHEWHNFIAKFKTLVEDNNAAI